MRWKNQRGSITVEATISLTVFMFFIITILSLINICRVQAKVAVAINSAAKEVSQYSYFYGLSGLHAAHSALGNAASEAEETINNVVSNTNELYNSIQTIAETGANTNIENPGDVLSSWDTIMSEVRAGRANVDTLEQQIGDICSDPKKMILGIGKIFVSEAIDETVSRFLAPPIAKTLCKKHFTEDIYNDPDAYLKSLGVVGGLDGIDFSNSKLFPGGENKIEFVAVYKVKIIQLFPIESEFVFCQKASTKGWLLGEKSE